MADINVVLLVIILVFFALWVLKTIAPFRCTIHSCRYRTWNPWNMIRHVEAKHVLER